MATQCMYTVHSALKLKEQDEGMLMICQLSNTLSWTHHAQPVEG